MTTHSAPRHSKFTCKPDYAVRLWTFETGDAALDPEAAADLTSLAGSRWLNDALDFIDEGYSIFDKDLII